MSLFRMEMNWSLSAVGPDRYTLVSSGSYGATHNIVEIFQQRAWFTGANLYYDPTNGTISWGDINMVGPGGDFEFHRDVIE